ncbi:hypothetical protein CAEBREN_18821 [Caenorhabditis brenneri]|uniref:Sdz-33 F-box domain-containing protein n=1 Tax=Caenorhabditis brenneri TaxID=135651 RepID=G0P7W0_CAEBE|nr:hypothetical protein CAEBREN_18821 [Caenorhabditis brenneri]
MALPLFKLPILVIKLLLETMGFVEIFLLTRTSLKIKRIYKHLVTIQNYEMRLYLENEVFIFEFQTKSGPIFNTAIYLNPKEYQHEDLFQLKFGSSDLAPSAFCITINGNLYLNVYWNRSINQATELYNALLEVFRIPLKGIQMDLHDVSVETHRSWINWNNEYFSDASYMAIKGTCSFHDYSWILENLRTQTLFFDVLPTDYPEDPGNIAPVNIELAEIYIQNGRWINMQQLITFKAQSISIRDTALTDLEINQVLRDWRDSEIPPKLEQLCIYFNREANLDVVLQGLDATDEDLMKPDGTLDQWSFNMTNGKKCKAIYAEYEDDVSEFGFEFQVGNNQ